MTEFTDKAVAENAVFYDETKSEIKTALDEKFYKEIDDNPDLSPAQKQGLQWCNGVGPS